MLRFGSAWHDVDAQIRAITELGLDSRRVILCTDDSHSATLVNEGHVNRAVMRAIAQGVPPIQALQMATLNTAEHFGVSRDVGMIAPGRFADILLVDDLSHLTPDTVITRGKIAVEDGIITLPRPDYHIPTWATSSIHLARLLAAQDFMIKAPSGARVKVIANVIGIIENQAPTRHLRMEVPIANEEVHVDIQRDLSKVALVERHRGSGVVQVGFVEGFGLNVPCAIGSTVAHDSHQMIIVGTDENCMAKAANELARVGGGQIVVREEQVIGMVDLPIAGLMSAEPADAVARKAASVLDGFRACGCKLNSPNMQLSLLALVVIPELRISDLGLVDVKQFEFIQVIELSG